ncbi:MAG: lectin like domain-containing protein [Clostridiales bacterium]|nr:lectin like domain-containing protein [Clostridiales bacterium]
MMIRHARTVILVCVALFALAGCGSAGKREEGRFDETGSLTNDAEVQETAETENPGAGSEPFAQLPIEPEASGSQMGAARDDESSDVQPGMETADGEEASVRLPERYDAREDGRTSPVKNQGDLGTCWAFASLLALESSLLPDEAFDFSEDHMSQNPYFALRQDEGGDYTMSMAYLLAWQGPVLEEEDPYGDGVSPEGLCAVKHVQEIQILPEKDREAIRQAVYTVGGVQSSLYTTMRNDASSSEYYNRESRAYCCTEDRDPNHDVVIVGWDDAFPKESFPVEVPGDGAFLCENSWGTQFGEDGFFYVSYYDENLGKNNILYSVVEDADNYDRIYQSDRCGWIGQLGYGDETAWAVNVYETEAQDECLEAVGFYATDRDTDYELYVVTNVPEDPSADNGACFTGRLPVASGHLQYSGYYTVRLEEAVSLAAGTRFGVMMRLTTPGVIHPIAIEYDAGDGKSRIDLGDGESYISPDGDQWENTETNQACNLCLKAYTSGTD